MIKKRRIRDITSLMFRDWKTLFLVVAFDVLFILVLLSLRFIQTSLDNVLFPLFANEGKGNLIYSIFYVIFEFFLVILAYSFFKYFIVKFIYKNLKEVKFKLKEFLAFLVLNIIIFIPLIILLIFVLDLVIISLNNWLYRGGIDPFMFVFVILAVGILALILFIFIYTFINILHFSFLKEQKIGKVLKRGIINSFRIGSYRRYWNNFKIIIVSGVFLLIIHFFVKSFIFDDFSSYVKNVGSYKVFVYWVISLVLYFLLLFNRFNFCIDASKVCGRDLESVYYAQEKKEKDV